nr:MAG TPA: hypothetical protein [Caudoviricetes sp.]
MSIGLHKKYSLFFSKNIHFFKKKCSKGVDKIPVLLYNILVSKIKKGNKTMKLNQLTLPNNVFTFATDRKEGEVLLQGTLSEELKNKYGKSLGELDVLRFEKLPETDTEDWELAPKYTEAYIIVLDA